MSTMTRYILAIGIALAVVSAQNNSTSNGNSTTTSSSSNNSSTTISTPTSTNSSVNGTSSSNNQTSSSNNSSSLAPAELCRDKPNGLYSWVELSKNSSGSNGSSSGSSNSSSSSQSANSTQCESYIFCSNSIGHILRCPNLQVFNPEKTVCQPKELVASPCGTRPQPLVAPLPPLCVGKKDGDNQKDLVDCRAYWKCENGTAVKQNCSIGLIFSDANNLNNCTEQGMVTGLNLCMPVSDPTLTTFCSQQQNSTGFFADPSTCNRGIICLNNTRTFYTCTGWPKQEEGANPLLLSGFEFSNKTMSCVDKREDTCVIKPLPL